MPSSRLPTPFSEIQDLHGKKITATFKADPHYFGTVAKRTRPYKNLPYQFKPAMERVADYVRTEMIPRVFEAEGPGWAPLAPMTMGQRISLGFPPAHPILIRTGDLFKELTDKAHPKHIEVVKTGRVARIELGGSSVKFIENQMGAGRVPARPMIPGTGFVPIPDADRKQMKQIIMETLIGRLQR